MRLRHLLDILSASAEYRILDVSIPSELSDEKYKDYLSLEQEILSIAKKRGGADPSRNEIDNIFSESYARKAAALLHAHLMGMQIPKSLYGEYMLVLQEAPRLLDVMIDMTVSRERFWAQTMQLIQLKQAIIQGVWPMESHLKQLPHWTPAIDKGIRKKGLNSILQLNFLDEESQGGKKRTKKGKKAKKNKSKKAKKSASRRSTKKHAKRQTKRHAKRQTKKH